ncbi:MAG TPA: G1 family glutamic endopeptidase [Acidimicrobiales bacterium]|nr:G1 family glutamic endopeptidase [Acidimicrobiales bacterium]
MKATRTLAAATAGAVLLAAGAAAGSAAPVLGASRTHGAGAAHDVALIAAHSHGIYNIQSSSNWSGYAEKGTGFTSVTGTWKIPTSKSTTGSKYSSQWIGIDGDGNQHLIQTGTEVDENNGSPIYRVWWEILPAAETLINEPVAPGETMKASIVKLSTGSWKITISNGSWTFTTTKSYSGPGTSVEWIVEAPFNGSVLPLDDTSRVTFTGTAVNGNNPSFVYSTDAIKMVQNGKTVESPSQPSAAGNSFTMAYGAKTPTAP